MNHLYKRVGSLSNAHVGAEFEKVAHHFFREKEIILTASFSLDIGVSEKTKKHCFDLGSQSLKIIVECKSHKWTASGKVPSAKITTWNEAMFYFHLAPREYKKYFFTISDKRNKNGETLVSYYRRINAHLIPDNVIFLEYNELDKSFVEHR
jgi:hypothetical protein